MGGFHSTLSNYLSDFVDHCFFVRKKTKVFCITLQTFERVLPKLLNRSHHPQWENLGQHFFKFQKKNM